MAVQKGRGWGNVWIWNEKSHLWPAGSFLGISKGKVGDIWGRKVIEDSGQGLMLCIESRE